MVFAARRSYASAVLVYLPVFGILVWVTNLIVILPRSLVSEISIHELSYGIVVILCLAILEELLTVMNNCTVYTTLA